MARTCSGTSAERLSSLGRRSWPRTMISCVRPRPTSHRSAAWKACRTVSFCLPIKATRALIGRWRMASRQRGLCSSSRMCSRQAMGAMGARWAETTAHRRPRATTPMMGHSSHRLARPISRAIQMALSPSSRNTTTPCTKRCAPRRRRSKRASMTSMPSRIA